MNAAEKSRGRALFCAALLGMGALSATPAAGLTLNLVSYSSAPPAIDSSGPAVAQFSLSFTPVGGSGHFTGFRLSSLGDVPPSQMTAALVKDSNNNGLLETGDVVLAVGGFSGGGFGLPPQAYVSASNELQPGGTATRYFIAVSFSGVPAGRTVRFGLLGPGDLLTGSDTFAVPPKYPLLSGDSLVYQRLFANPSNGVASYPVPSADPRAGGYDTGLYVSAGQRVQVQVKLGDAWSMGGSLVTGDGATPNGLLGPFKSGALVGRIGAGPWFLIGNSTAITAGLSGPLYVAANDSGTYSDNSGSLRFTLAVLPSTTTKVWIGGTLGFETRADLDGNWAGGGRPRSGEKAHFGSGALADCDWNIPNAQLSEVVLSTAFAGRRLRLVRPPFGTVNSLFVSTRADFAGGRFEFEPLSGGSQGSGVHELSVGGRLVVRSGAALALDDGRLGLREGMDVVDGAFLTLKSSNPLANLVYGYQGGRWSLFVDRSTLAVTGGLVLRDLDKAVLSSASVAAFDRVDFSAPFNSTNPFVTVLSPVPVNLTFRNWSASGVGRATGLAASVPGGQIHLYDSVGPSFGTPHTSAPPGVVFWHPDGGGLPGSITGTLSCAGVCGASAYRVIATTDPAGGRSPQGASANAALGVYTLSGLPAPATYFLFAFDNGGAGDLPAFRRARGGWLHAGFMRSEPVFLADGGLRAATDLGVKGWGSVSGVVGNNSAQAGPVVVETWDGVPYSGASTRVAQGLAGPTGSFGFETAADVAGVAHSTFVYAFVDLNGNLTRDSFEADASSTAPSPAEGGLAAVPAGALTLTGGGAAPGGLVTLSTLALTNGAISNSGDSPVMRLTLSNSSAPSSVAALNLRWAAPLPPYGAQMSVWEDDGDGAFRANGDLYRGGVSLTAAARSSGTAVFFQPVLLAPNQAKNLFVTANTFGTRPSSAAVAIDNSAAFGLSGGVMASQPALYPVETGPLQVRIGVDSLLYASPEGSGGAMTGVQAAVGQDIRVLFSGQWRTGPNDPPVGGQGKPGSAGLNTILPGANLGELIGRISPCAACSSPWFRVGGATMPLSAFTSGELYLAINDYVGSSYDNSGSLLADFSVSGATTGVLSGTVRYPLPVQGTGYITAYRYGAAFSSTTVSFLAAMPSYAFSFPSLPPGEYTLGVTHSASADFGVSGKATLAAGATAQLDVFMYQGTGGISGPIGYSGVLDYGDFFVAASTSSDLTKEVRFAADYRSASFAPYTLSNLPAPATYYVVGFRDGNFNGRPDGPEPFGYYGAPGGSPSSFASFATPVFVGVGANLSSIGVTLSDTGGLSGPVAVSTAAGGVVQVLAGRGVPGSAAFAPESQTVVPVLAGAAAGVAPYSLGLMRAATDYALFAFHDKNGNGQPDSGEPATQTPANLAVSQGAMTSVALNLLVAAPPPPTSAFSAVSTAPASVIFRWEGVAGATSYLLRRTDDSVFATVNATYYVDGSVAANTPSQVFKVAAANGNGVGPALALSTLAFSRAAAPGNPTVAGAGASGAGLSWGSGGNPAGTRYRLYRSTLAAGVETRLVYEGAALSFFDGALAPSTTYRWDLAAVNGNGLETFASSPAGAITPGTSGNVFAGTVTYSGAQAGRFVVQSSTASDFSGALSSAAFPNLPVQTFFLASALGAGYHHLRIFVDADADGRPDPGEDRYTGGPFAFSGSPVGGLFAVSADTVPPAAPAGLTAAPAPGAVELRWAAPTKNADGSPLQDLLGFIVQRSSGLGLPFVPLQSAASPLTAAVFRDADAKPGAVAYYRVLALDLGRNLSAPTAAQPAAPSAGGSISGFINSFTLAASGPFRVRLTSSPAPGAPALAEVSVGSYAFNGLADGTYFLRAYRDLDSNGVEDPVTEPGGTYGGLQTPYAVPVVNGNAVTLADVTVCDRTQLLPGVAQAGALLPGGCPARDKGPENVTQLFALPVGNGAPGSLGLGTQVNLSVSDASFGDSELIVLGPDGAVVARDNRPGGASLSFIAAQAGVYLIEPTSFLAGGTGPFTLRLRLDGGFGGAAAGSVFYAGSRPGLIHTRLYAGPGESEPPLFLSTRASPGGYTFAGLPDGVYYLRSFRDANGNLVRDLGEPTGQYGFSASSPTPVVVAGGFTAPSGPLDITLSDPAAGSLKGAVVYDGTQPGSIRVQAGLPSCPFCGDLDTIVASASTGTGSSYFLGFLPAATSYILRAFVDNNGNGNADRLEPLVSQGHITVNAGATTTLSVILQDPGAAPAGAAVIRGTVSYSGAASGTVFVGFSRDPLFSSTELLLQLPGTGYFQRDGVLGDATYYMAGFIDSVRNGTPDFQLGEPHGAGAPANATPPFSETNPPSIYVPLFGVVDTSLRLEDPPGGSLRGRVTYNGASAAPRIVVQARRSAVASGSSAEEPGQAVITRSPGVAGYDYQVPLLPAGDYSVSAFLDSNDNRRYDPGEPFQSRYGVAVASGPGSFPAYGNDLTVFDAGTAGASASAGRVRGEVTYLGSQGGPVFFRLFTNAAYTGQPFASVAVNGPPGPGNFVFERTGLPFGVTFYIDAFRDPSGAGVYNPTFHARSALDPLGRGVLLSQSRPDQRVNGDLSDPGGGGTVNAFSGRLDAAAGARFDGGSFDAVPAVVIDTITGVGAPPPNVIALHVTTQNEGLLPLLVRYSSAGVFLSSAVVGPGLDGLHAPVPDGSGNVFLPRRRWTAAGAESYFSEGTLVRFGPGFGDAAETAYPGADLRALTYSAVNRRLYAAGRQDDGQLRLIEVDPANMVVTSTALWTPPPSSCQSCGGAEPQAVAVSPDGATVSVLAVTGVSDGGAFELMFLLRFARFDGGMTAGTRMTLSALKDITGLRLPADGVSLDSDASGNLFAAGTEPGANLVRTYRFDAALNQTASAQIPGVITHFSGGLGNMRVDRADGHVYEAWESSANAGDFLAVRYDNDLKPLATRLYDGLDKTREDFPFSIAVLNSSAVVLGGGVLNATFDSALVRFNMNASGGASAPPAAVAVATVQPVFGSVSYAGVLASSGVLRTVLLPAGQVTPVRFASATFAASRPYLFNNVPFGTYFVRSFLDLNGNLAAEAGEPVAWSKAGGEEFVSGSSYPVAPLTLCDRRSIASGAPVTGSFSASDCPAPDRGGAYQRLYAFSARRGEPVTLSLEALGFNDSYLNLYGPTGDLLFSADDGGAGADARINGFVIPADGLYTVAASPFAPGVTGSFRLTLVSGAGAPGTVSGRVDYNGSQGGVISVARFSSPLFSSSTVLDRISLASTRSFAFPDVAAGATYYFGAFVDVNANNAPDAGEDAGFFGAGSPAPVRVSGGQQLTGVNISIAPSTASAASASFITGQVTLPGAPAAPLILEFWSSAQFTGRPVATRLIPAGVGAFDAAVPGGASYYPRAFLDLDGDFFPGPGEPKGVYAPRGQGAESVFAPAGASVPGIDIALIQPGLTASGSYAGEGEGALSAGSGTAGSLVNIAVELTAGEHGVGAGGQFGFIAPRGFPVPAGVTASSTGGATLSSVTMSGPSAFVSVTSGTVPAGYTITLQWNGVPLPCQAGAQPFSLASSQDGRAAPAPLLKGSPSFNVNIGQAETVSVQPPYFTLRAGELSDPLFVETRDRCGNKVSVTAAETLELRAKVYDPVSGGFQLDPSVGLSSAPLVSTAAAITLDFAIGQSSRAFHAVSASTGFKPLELYADLGAAPPATYYFGASVVPAAALSGVRVSTSPTAVGGSTASIRLSAAGVPNSVYVSFTLADAAQSWHLLVSSVPFKSGLTPSAVWERWGVGQPSAGELAWDGRFSPWINGGGRVPNGLYYALVELGGGGVKEDRLQVTVSLPQFAGKVFDSAVTPRPPLAGATVRVYGPAGSFSALTGSDGVFTLPGLGAGAYRLSASRPDYAEAAVDLTLDGSARVTSYAARAGGVTVSSSPSGGLDLALVRAPKLIVSPSMAAGVTAPAYDLWGSLQVRPSSGSPLSTLFGSMRLRAGTTVFDDGGQWDPATQQFIAGRQLSFNVPVGTYTVLGELAGFTRSSATVYVGPGGAFAALAAFEKKSSVSGQLFRSPNPEGFFASVSAVPLSTAPGAAGGFGGAYLSPGATSAVYLIGGLEPGAYLLRANAQGLAAATSGPILLPANTDLTRVDFAPFAAGAALSGRITVAGPSAGGTPLYLNAWSPGSLNSGSTQVYTAAGTDVSVLYALPGLDAGATYQLYVDVGAEGVEYDVPGGFPLSVLPQAGYDFTLQPASGAVSGLIRLPAGATDFANAQLRGVTIASLRPQEVGREFVEVSTALPRFRCADGSAPDGGGFCPAGVSSATFLVTGVNTQTLDLTFFHRSSGQNAKQRLSIVNGATSTVVADLSGAVYSISGSILNQISNPLFDTTPEIVANAPYLQPLGYPAGLSSSTARVVAVRQELASFGVAVSTVFNEANSRVGFITPGGLFSIPGVPNGAYFVRTADLRSCATCDIAVPSVGRLVSVAGAAVSSVTLTLSDGFSVSGSISLDGDVQDSAVLELQVLNKRQEVVRSTTVYLGDSALGVSAGELSYAFANLPPGEFYTLLARDRREPEKYVGRPLKFPDPALSPNGLAASLSGQNILLKRAAQLVGRLRDGGTGELIGAANAALLAPNFRVTATANPWIEGGFAVAAASVSGRPLQADGFFRVGPLLPGVDYDLRLAQTSWDPSFLQGGSQNYGPVTLGGLRLSPGESRDVGVVALGQGSAIKGVVMSTVTGAGLGNLKVTARPSFGDEADLLSQTFTNNAGAYTLWVSTQVSNQFDVTAAPRDGNQASDGRVYGQVTLRNMNLLSAATANFLLAPLAGGVTGQVVVADAASGGSLSYPFGDRRGFPAAAVNLQPLGVVPQNPLGDIETATDERGFFSVPGLSTGVYALHAASLGYSVFSATASVTASSFRLFRGSDTPSNDLPGSVLSLQRGATVTGRVLKSDGSAPSVAEVGGVAAANFAEGEYLVGSVETDEVARTVNAYTISGFRAGVSYDLVLISGGDGKTVSFPVEGDGVLFAAAESTATKTINLTFRPARMDCLASARALDAGRTQFGVQVDCLKPLRNESAADADLDSILRVSTFTANGAGLNAPDGRGSFQAGSKALSADRRRLTAVYQKAANESRFSVRVTAAASDLDPNTGRNFSVDKAFDFFTGLESATDGRVSNINGGQLNLAPSAQDELLGLDERGGLSFQPGTFAEGSDGAAGDAAVANPTVTVNVTMTKGTDRQLAQTLAIQRLGFVPAGLQAAESGSSYPPEMWAAMSAYRAQAAASTSTIGGANPLSAFYSIFLPLGVRHQLKKRADLTLSFNTLASTAVSANNINVWFYNAAAGRYEPESRDRRLDLLNKTITVSVDHFSTFVVLDSTPVLTSGVSFAGSDIIAASFPNPADCVAHSGLLRNTAFFAGGTIPTFTGQMIRASIPPDPSSKDLTVNIYNLSGQLVRTMPQGPVPGGQTYYMPWNCSNDSGKTVSSGVYLGEIKWGGYRQWIKMAIIKGSGL